MAKWEAAGAAMRMRGRWGWVLGGRRAAPGAYTTRARRFITVSCLRRAAWGSGSNRLGSRPPVIARCTESRTRVSAVDTRNYIRPAQHQRAAPFNASTPYQETLPCCTAVESGRPCLFLEITPFGALRRRSVGAILPPVRFREVSRAETPCRVGAYVVLSSRFPTLSAGRQKWRARSPPVRESEASHFASV